MVLFASGPIRKAGWGGGGGVRGEGVAVRFRPVYEKRGGGLSASSPIRGGGGGGGAA